MYTPILSVATINNFFILSERVKSKKYIFFERLNKLILLGHITKHNQNTAASLVVFPSAGVTWSSGPSYEGTWLVPHSLQSEVREHVLSKELCFSPLNHFAWEKYREMGAISRRPQQMLKLSFSSRCMGSQKSNHFPTSSHEKSPTHYYLDHNTPLLLCIFSKRSLQVKFSMRASNPNLQIKKIPCNKQIQYTT
jgi:hypothetical protein